MIDFTDILGQARAIETLLRAYRADRLPHGLIFAGPVGVGKATTAKALAALLLCEKSKTDSACGECESCRALEAGMHPDYRIITKDLIRYHDKTGKSKGIDLSINVIRPELIERASRKPALGRAKVFVVEQADAMNPQAQNALLKTLEEPAGRTVIILLTDQPGALLPTVRSRCQLIAFASLEPTLVRQELEKRDINPRLAAEAAAISEGSLGQALRWIEDEVIDQARSLIEKLNEMLAGQRPADLEVWFKKAAEAYAARQLERDDLASKDQAAREGLSLYLRLAASHFRRQLLHSTQPDRLQRLCAAIDTAVQAELYLDSNVNIPLIFQQLTISWERELAAACPSNI